VPGGRLRWKLPSEPVFTLAIGMPDRLLDVNAYITPEAALSISGAGPPMRCNVPVTAPSPEGAMEESPRGLDDEHPEQPMRSRQSPNGTHAVSLLPFRIVAPPAALAEGS
jgi:hypothetical protein